MQANSFPSANFAWFSDSYNQLYPLLFLLRREVVYHTTPYLSSHPPGQSELSVGNASAPHSYRSQAVCDFLWRIPSADTSLSERNSEMIGVYYQRRVRIHGGKLNGVMGVFMQVQGKRNRRVVVLLEGVMAVAAEVHPDLIEVIS